MALKPDLLDRSILIELQRIRHSEMKEERELLAEFDRTKPHILGGIFSVLARTLKIYPQVKLSSLPRMADFTRWGYAVAEALGIGGNRFLQAYYSNIKTQNQQVVEGNPIATCLVRLVEREKVWMGTASELLEKLSDEAETCKINTNLKIWPKTPNFLTRKLNTLKINFEESGISYKTEHRQKGTYVRLCLKETDSIATSASLSKAAEESKLKPDGNMTTAEQHGGNDDKFPTKSGEEPNGVSEEE